MSDSALEASRRLVVADILPTSAARFGGRPAVTLGDRTLSFTGLSAVTDRLAAGLRSRGLERGDRVVWQGSLSLEAVALRFATARLGVVFIPLNPAWGTEESAPVLDLVEPGLLVGDTTRCDVTLEALPESVAPTKEPIVVPNVAEDDPEVVFFTSGSTGTPKGVVLSQRVQRIRAMIEASSYPVGPCLCLFPLFHMAGWQLAASSLLSGEHVVFVADRDGPAIVDAIEHHRVAHVYAIPAVWRRILGTNLQDRDLTSVRNADTGTSYVAPDLLEAIRTTFPAARTTVTYGSTEAGLVCRLGPEDLFRKPGSVGPPGVGVHVQIGDDGELLVRSPYLMSGYFSDATATREVFEDGWFHTGDLATLDEEGYLSIVGRVKDIIRTGGESVAPAEVEAVLATHPALDDVAVAGMPDEDWGEVVTVFVVVKDGQPVTVDDLRRHCEGRLAAYKAPRRLIEVAEIPRTGATMQIERRRLVKAASSDTHHDGVDSR